MEQKFIDFSKYSSIKIGPIVAVDIINSCTELKSEHFIVGGANNLLLSNNPPPLAKLSKKFDYIKIENNSLIVGGATPSGKIFSFCKKHNIAHFEYLANLPGSLGGLVFMNAGMGEYEIFNHLVSIKSCKGDLLKNEISYGYRYGGVHSLILEATFELSYGFDAKLVEFFKQKRASQPSMPSAGSCFKNPKGDYAARLIEAVGLKGHSIGGAGFSTIHANFLVNSGSATFNDVLKLIDEAKKRVKERFDISLECEIKIVQD